ncbi:PREDICTED: probable E3 ubiquitin-protein ligase RHB1A [Camelina sativa]|uniref:RING-type E3 ubiquitin transferase n=1 Tax=Camelina sativa TaxID=90675 RepID=A0ABM0VHP4_CAMSA|nr:PREDICTED: probable E3 ubiquitin-protein ligase RHB1A [Camelina sativa]
MGGCCCSSRKSHLVGTPVYYYCPESFEEVGPSGTRAAVGSALTAGLLVDIGLETSIPDTFCAPAPLPYDLLLGKPQSTDSESSKGRISGSSFETLATCEDLGGSDCKTQDTSDIISPRKSDFSNQKGWKKLVDEEEEDECCPICFEDYDGENPRLTTKCEHDFHLSCLLEWIERSDSCPICDKEVVFDDCLN